MEGRPADHRPPFDFAQGPRPMGANASGRSGSRASPGCAGFQRAAALRSFGPRGSRGSGQRPRATKSPGANLKRQKPSPDKCERSASASHGSTGSPHRPQGPRAIAQARRPPRQQIPGRGHLQVASGDPAGEAPNPINHVPPHRPLPPNRLLSPPCPKAKSPSPPPPAPS